MDRTEKRNSRNRLAILMIFTLNNVFTISGYAGSIHYNEILTYFFAMIFLFGAFRKRYTFGSFATRLPRGLFAFLLPVFVAILLISEGDYKALANFITLFGIGAWVSLFSRIKWNEEHYLREGVIISVFSIVLTYFFLPGQIWSGWNRNSAVILLSSQMLGFCLILMSNSRKKNVFLFALLIPVFWLYIQLGSRNTILGLFLFLFFSFNRKMLTSKKAYRIVYATTIGLNVLFPLLINNIMKLSLFSTFNFFLGRIVESKSNLGVNGREVIWQYASLKILEKPFFGEFGYRAFYSHNFSTDVLLEFGWFGWLFFALFLIYFLERCYDKRGNTNVLVLGFLVVLFVNTFENVFLANDYITIFPYIIIGACLSIRNNEWNNMRNT